MLKTVRVFLVFIAVLVVGIVVLWGGSRYEKWQRGRDADKAVELISAERDRIYQMQMADTVGGKTPQETLTLYIAAVENGDYVLASKYYVIENQEKEMKAFSESNVNLNQKEEYLGLLKEILNGPGSYSFDKSYFSFNNEILLNLQMYPNGIWKIIEI